MNVDAIKSAVEKGNDFIVASQISNNNKKAGWASQYDKVWQMSQWDVHMKERL